MRVLLLLLVFASGSRLVLPDESASPPPAGAAPFVPPDTAGRQSALGDLEGLPPGLRAALVPDKHFLPMGFPRSSDWLACHAESGQTVDQFLTAAGPRPTPERRTIHLQPLGDDWDSSPVSLELLRRAASAFFQLPVVLRSPLPLPSTGITTREDPSTKRVQLLTTDLLRELRSRLPRDAFCLLGITRVDLYPGSDSGFVFGQASLQKRVGIFSLARLGDHEESAPGGAAHRARLTRRALRVLVHETAHMFNMHHCIYYRCVMNGSAHLREAEARPLFLCPVDLRKLWEIVGFEVLERYEQLGEVLPTRAFRQELDWLRPRLRRIRRARIDLSDS